MLRTGVTSSASPNGSVTHREGHEIPSSPCPTYSLTKEEYHILAGVRCLQKLAYKVFVYQCLPGCTIDKLFDCIHIHREGPHLFNVRIQNQEGCRLNWEFETGIPGPRPVC